MTAATLGSACVPDDEYLQNIKSLCDENCNWACDFSKHNVSVYSKSTSNSNIKIFKVVAVFKDVSAELLFDTLLDSDYRKIWDKYMLDGYDLCHINPNNDIGYYALRTFPGLRDRDFVLQRSWLQTRSEFIISSRSVFHKSLPPRKQFIRALALLTAYVIRKRSASSCEMVYITQCDPRGRLPAWAVNKATQYVAPRVMKRLSKACNGYNAWKQSNQPDFKPWLCPEQFNTPRVNWDDVLSKPDFDLSLDVTIDESAALEGGDDDETV